MDKTAVTALAWVPRGVSEKKLTKKEITDEEWAELQETLGEEKPDATMAQDDFSDLKQFDMDNYDEEDEVPGMQFFTTLDSDLPLTEKKDPNLIDVNDSDSEDDEIQASDMIFVAANVEEEQCSLEVFVYEEDECHLFMHHDIHLSAYPLCLEWLNTSRSEKGSYMAVGSFNPSIEIWDLNVLDPALPHCTLGHKRKGKKTTGHTDAVLGLSRNGANAHVLASGSADRTVKLWDVNEAKCLETFTHHQDKVQVVRWHPVEHSVLLTAGFDRKVSVLDVRQSSNSAVMTKISADAESASWSMQNPMQCFVSSEDGKVVCLDVRKISSGSAECVWTLDAHDVACTGVQDGAVKNLLITSSVDGDAKIWDTSSGMPRLVYCRELKAGPLFSCSISPEAPTVAIFGGSQPVVWDLRDTEFVCSAFNI